MHLGGKPMVWCEGLPSLVTSDGPFPNSNLRVSTGGPAFSGPTIARRSWGSHTLRRSAKVTRTGKIIAVWWSFLFMNSSGKACSKIIAFHGNIWFHHLGLWDSLKAVAEAMDEEEAATLNGGRQLARKGTANLINIAEYLTCNLCLMWLSRRLMRIHQLEVSDMIKWHLKKCKPSPEASDGGNFQSFAHKSY